MPFDSVRRLYDEHASPLLAYACAILGERAAAEDVVHQVFLKLMRENISPVDPLPYLFRAVRNAALNARRDGLRNVPLNGQQDWFETGPGQDREAVIALQSTLLQIPDEQREVVVLHVWCEMTMEEIGRLLNISSNTVASRYRYGLSKLRELMRPLEVKK